RAVPKCAECRLAAAGGVRGILVRPGARWQPAQLARAAVSRKRSRRSDAHGLRGPAARWRSGATPDSHAAGRDTGQGSNSASTSADAAGSRAADHLGHEDLRKAGVMTGYHTRWA